MRLYLDNCCFNRPFDDQSSLTIRLETEAKLSVQEKIKEGHISLAWSYILDFENSANPFPERQVEIQTWKDVADFFIKEPPEILLGMNKLLSNGFKPVDALHLSCALALSCDYFLTVDKGILKKSADLSTIKILNPIDFIIEWEA